MSMEKIIIKNEKGAVIIQSLLIDFMGSKEIMIHFELSIKDRNY